MKRIKEEGRWRCFPYTYEYGMLKFVAVISRRGVG
jgi:hypothetical protein